MPKAASIEKTRPAKSKRAADGRDHDGFSPCSQDMTICGDCEGNRAKKKCPRLREWLAKREA